MGNKNIGIEITELTTGYDKQVFKASRRISEKGIKQEEDIIRVIHGFKEIDGKAKPIDIAGTPAIDTGCINLYSNRTHFAEEIKRKHDKYQETIWQYDEFIILGNAASGSGLDISEQYEVD